MWSRRRPLSTQEKVEEIIARNQAHAAWRCFMSRIAGAFLASDSW